MSEIIILGIGVATAIGLGFVIHELCKPSCFMCTWCGKLYTRDGKPAGPEDTYAPAHFMCQECAAKNDGVNS
jgi:hypothetical protein